MAYQSEGRMERKEIPEMNNWTRSLLEYLDDQFYAHPRIFLVGAVCLGFVVAAVLD